MPERLTFPTVQLLKFSRTPTGGSASFAGSLTNAVQKALEWAEIPECFTSCDLDGDLVAHLMSLTPKEKELEKHSLDLDIGRIHKFQLVRRELEGKKGKGFRQELHFKVQFTDPQGARKLEGYMISCGKGSLAISYSKQPKQGELVGDGDQGKPE